MNDTPTSSLPIMQAQPLIKRLEGWTDARYLIELEYVVYQQRKQLQQLAQIKEILVQGESK